MNVEDQMNIEDYESTLQLLADLRDLLRFEELSVDDRLSAVDHAITTAVGGLPEQARDFVRDLLQGRISP